MENQEVEVIEASTEWESRPVADILVDGKLIDCKKAADSVLMWLEANVENYIDNHVKMFKLDLVLDNSDSMAEIRKLQELYRSVPDKEDSTEEEMEASTECRMELDKVTAKVHNEMMKSEELLSKLFQRMIYYYEMMGIKDGDMLIQEMTGAINILKFEYEAFEVGVKILAPEVKIKREDEEREVFKQYTIPEGFTVWLEIAFKANQRPTSLF